MKRIIIAAAIAAAASAPVFAQQTRPQAESPSKPQNAARQHSRAQTFVQKAAAGDQFEMMSSRLALEKAQSPEIKSFAQKMVDDHMKNSQQLASVADQAGIALAQGGSTMGSTTGSSGMTSDSSRGSTAMGGAQGGRTGGSGMSSGSVGSAETTGSTTSTMNAGDMNVPLDAKQRQALDRLRNASGAEFDRLYVQAQMDAHKDAIALYQAYAEKGDDASLKSFAQQMLPIIRQHEQELRTMRPRSS